MEKLTVSTQENEGGTRLVIHFGEYVIFADFLPHDDRQKVAGTLHDIAEKIENTKMNGFDTLASNLVVSRSEANLIRQWCDGTQDLFQRHNDHYALAKKIYEFLKMRVPHSISDGIEKPEKTLTDKGVTP